MKLAITGCVACGKTTFSKLLAKELGFKLISADAIVSDLYKEEFVLEKIREIFGAEVFFNKELNKTKLAELIFEDFKKRKILESYIHPLVVKRIHRELKENNNLIMEVPLLFETGLERYFDIIITTYSNTNKIIQRLESRGLNIKTAKKLIASQLDIEIKKKKSNFLVDTNGKIERQIKEAKKIASLILKN